MVTATLTAAALNAQITSQRQRVLALETTLKTMESGMDKHMVQVQLKYAQGYLESLREQLAALQATRMLPHQINSLTATSQAHCTEHGPALIRETAAAAAGAVGHGQAVAAAAAQACMAMDQQVPVQYADLVSAAATETSYSAEQHQQQQDGGGLRAAVVGHGRVLCKPAEAAGDVDACLSCSAAGDSSLVDEDDWVCLQDADYATSSSGRSGWSGLLKWR